jgi:hypothetical protein
VLDKLPGRIDDEDLMTLLKLPACVGPLQDATIKRLGKQVDTNFDNNIWKVIEHPRYAPLARTPLVLKRQPPP